MDDLNLLTKKETAAILSESLRTFERMITESSMDDLNLLTRKETMEVLKVSLSTFSRWQAKGIGPVGRVIDGRTWWTRSDIAAWEENLAKENQILNPALR